MRTAIRVSSLAKMHKVASALTLRTGELTHHIQGIDRVLDEFTEDITQTGVGWQQRTLVTSVLSIISAPCAFDPEFGRNRCLSFTSVVVSYRPESDDPCAFPYSSVCPIGQMH